MYRGGKICQDIHFAPLWAKNTPKLGIAHALAISLGPWLGCLSTKYDKRRQTSTKMKF
jgi:hypothetical protein